MAHPVYVSPPSPRVGIITPQFLFDVCNNLIKGDFEQEASRAKATHTHAPAEQVLKVLLLFACTLWIPWYTLLLLKNYVLEWKFIICDMIKSNESDVGDIGFEILAKTLFQFFCFIKLFLALTNSSNSATRYPIWGLHQNEAFWSYEKVV